MLLFPLKISENLTFSDISRGNTTDAFFFFLQIAEFRLFF